MIAFCLSLTPDTRVTIVKIEKGHGGGIPPQFFCKFFELS